MDEQIVPNRPNVEIIEIPQISEYINLIYQLIPLASKALDLAQQLGSEKRDRLKIQENADIQRKEIERRMNQLDAELEADIEINKNVIFGTMRVFEKMVEDGRIEEAMILHERVISKLSGRVSIAADKFNQNNPDGDIKFYTT